MNNNIFGNSMGGIFGDNQLNHSAMIFMNEWKRSNFYNQLFLLLVDQEKIEFPDIQKKDSSSQFSKKREFELLQPGEQIEALRRKQLQEQLAKMLDQIYTIYQKILNKNENIIKELNFAEKSIVDKKNQCTDPEDQAKLTIIEEKYNKLYKYFQKLNTCDLFYLYYKIFIKLVPKSNKAEFEKLAKAFEIGLQEQLATLGIIKKELHSIGTIKKAPIKQKKLRASEISSATPFEQNTSDVMILQNSANKYVEKCYIRVKNLLDGLESGRALDTKTKKELAQMQEKLNDISDDRILQRVEEIKDIMQQIMNHTPKSHNAGNYDKKNTENTSDTATIKEISPEQKELKKVFNILISNIDPKVSSTRIKGTNSCGDGTFTNHIFLPTIRHFSNNIFVKNALEFPLSLADLGKIYGKQIEDSHESRRSFVLLMNNYSEKRNDIKDIIVDLRGVIGDFAKGSYFHKKSRNNLGNFLQRFDEIIEDYFQ